ncbi:MAG: amino-acid N-acetyltransferase [Microbacteriaceae bacterium]|nr:amino-acid N-acetyltransferase [Microbacteriaceae bacterium]
MTSPTSSGFEIRAARASDVRSIQALREPSEGKVLLHHDLVALFEKVQEFSVVEDASGKIIAAGALHIMWEDLAEVRSIVVASNVRGQGVGHALVESLLQRASALGVHRVFCLTFEVGFFASLGFEEISDVPVDEATFAEMSRSADDGVAEFLDLARVKENTLGNTRMLKRL